jgi:hypothetical protein
MFKKNSQGSWQGRRSSCMSMKKHSVVSLPAYENVARFNNRECIRAWSIACVIEWYHRYVRILGPFNLWQQTLISLSPSSFDSFGRCTVHGPSRSRMRCCCIHSLSLHPSISPLQTSALRPLTYFHYSPHYSPSWMTIHPSHLHLPGHFSLPQLCAKLGAWLLSMGRL